MTGWGEVDEDSCRLRLAWSDKGQQGGPRACRCCPWPASSHAPKGRVQSPQPTPPSPEKNLAALSAPGGSNEGVRPANNPIARRDVRRYPCATEEPRDANSDHARSGGGSGALPRFEQRESRGLR